MPCCTHRFLQSRQHSSCFYLGVTHTEVFFMASNASYLDVRSMALADLLCFVAYHLRISCCLCAITFQSYASSCCIELVARRQHPASFISSRSNLTPGLDRLFKADARVVLGADHGSDLCFHVFVYAGRSLQTHLHLPDRV